MAYGAEVMQLGEDVVGDIAKRHGAIGLIRLVADIAARGTPRANKETNREGAAEKNATPARFRRENG